MTVTTVLERLRSLGDEKLRLSNQKRGAGENQFGVKMGDIRSLAKEIKVDHDLGLELWKTGNADARFLATLLVKPKLFTTDDLEVMLQSITYPNLVDWFGTNVVKPHPDKEAVREKWMRSEHEMIARWGGALPPNGLRKTRPG